MASVGSIQGCSFLLAAGNDAFTPEDFSADEQLMIQTAEQFSRKEVIPLAERIDAQEPGLMPSLIRKAGELGFCGADTPERYGGLGLSKNLSARMLEFLSLNGSMSVTIGVTSGISQVGLALFGNEPQRSKYLPPLAGGEQIGAYCLSEPNSGSDALSMSTRADRKGDHWVLNGTKMWISNAQWAEQFLVMAKVDGERVTAFLVERGFPGLVVEREEHKMGLKGSSTARVTLENCEVPLENMLYEEGKGHHVAFNALNIGRFKLSSMSIGPARYALEEAIGYARDRKQFGRPITDFGLIRKKIADSAALFFAAESMIYRTGAMIDGAFESAHADASLDEIQGNRKAAEEFAIECSACKVFSTEAEALIVDHSLQMYGGYGFTEEFPIARVYRDARVSKIYEGTNEINRLFIADRVLRKFASAPARVEEDSLFASWLAQGLAAARQDDDQLRLGALADLIVIHYASQSARLRAAKRGGLAIEMSQYFDDLMIPVAAQAIRTLTNEAISLPASNSTNMNMIADEAISARGPI